jgi:hypothetical protein
MNKHQAREILLRYRPGTRDEQDPEVREALALADQDEELGRWLENHCQFQQAMRAGARDVEVPAGLKEQILSEQRAFLNLRRLPRRAALAGALVAVAGVILVGVLLLPARVDPEAQFDTFRSRMVRTAQRGYGMDLETRNAAEIRQFLGARNAPQDWQSATALEREPLLGCAVLTWRSQPAAMICYGRGKQPDMWLFVVASKAMPDPPAEGAAVFATVNQLNTLSWSRAGKTYVLAGSMAEEELRRRLAIGG